MEAQRVIYQQSYNSWYVFNMQQISSDTLPARENWTDSDPELGWIMDEGCCVAVVSWLKLSVIVSGQGDPGQSQSE